MSEEPNELIEKARTHERKFMAEVLPQNTDACAAFNYYVKAISQLKAHVTLARESAQNWAAQAGKSEALADTLRAQLAASREKAAKERERADLNLESLRTSEKERRELIDASIDNLREMGERNDAISAQLAASREEVAGWEEVLRRSRDEAAALRSRLKRVEEAAWNCIYLSGECSCSDYYKKQEGFGQPDFKQHDPNCAWHSCGIESLEAALSSDSPEAEPMSRAKEKVLSRYPKATACMDDESRIVIMNWGGPELSGSFDEEEEAWRDAAEKIEEVKE